MVLFLTALLGFSIVGLVTLVAVKRWELSSGRVLFSDVRPAVGHALHQGLHFVERQAPNMLKVWAERGWRYARTVAHRLVALAVVYTEALLERTLHHIRHTTSAPKSGSASPFLREVAEHKRSLLEGEPEQKRAIYEE